MTPPRILQIGLGGFGRMHLQAWLELGWRERLFVAETDPQRLALARGRGVPAEQTGADPRPFLEAVDAVDIVTGTDTHAALIRRALEAGKDVFVEKPMTATSAEAEALKALAQERGRVLQVGYYYRVHPISRWIADRIASGALGRLRYLSGRFMGFKRPRTDVGVTYTDAIHFIDLFNAFLKAQPTEAFAVIRDHLGRGLEDLSVALLTYPGGILAKIESGYIQPGRWNDRVVPQAKTTKEITLCGEAATVEADFETGRVELHRVRHVKRDGAWALLNEGMEQPALPSVGPVEQVKIELEDFLRCVSDRSEPAANADQSGVALARLMEALYRSAREGRSVAPADSGAAAAAPVEGHGAAR